MLPLGEELIGAPTDEVSGPRQEWTALMFMTLSSIHPAPGPALQDGHPVHSLACFA